MGQRSVLLINVKRFFLYAKYREENDMRVSIRKTFFAIGQGCFYAERLFFNGIAKTIIYDCGSCSNGRLWKEIDMFGNNVIDFLILSHFHVDHINGVEKLRDKREIRNVIIPKIDPLDILFYLGSDNTVAEILLDPESFFGENTNVIRISSEGEREPSPEPLTLPDHSKSITYSHDNIFSALKMDNDFLWVLKFYIDEFAFINSKISKNNLLKDDDKNLLRGIITINDFKKCKNDLAKLYRKISKNRVNVTSLSMLSAPWKRHYWYPEDFGVSVMNGDTLLNTETRISQLVNHFNGLIRHDVDFHVPHHGSHYNLCRPINEWRNRRAFVMSGYDNNHGHPSGIILRKLSDAGIPTEVLTEYDRNIVANQII